MSDRPLGTLGERRRPVRLARAGGRVLARGFPRGSLARLVAGRFGQALVVALVVGLVGFAMMEALPGDAAFRIAAGRYGYDQVSAAAAEAVRAERGLDRPAIWRLAEWVGQTLTFDLGRSAVTGAPVTHAVAAQLGHSALLAAAALAIAVAIALPVGSLSGLRPGGALDRASEAASVMLRATPAFLLGVVLMLLLAVELRLFPAAGHAHAGHLALPALTLGLVLASVLTRVVRDAVLDATTSEAYRFARHKGLSERDAFLRHGLRSAAVPVVAYLGVQAALLLEGVVVVESVFAWPGIGHALTHAIFERDVAVVQGTALTLGLTFVTISLAVDLACRAIDPRTRA
ncbi:MAG: ABC transporter permease [Paracoccaceae bacterium]